MKDNFRDRVEAKLKATGAAKRSDLELNDVKVIEAGSAVRVLATYSPLHGPPSVWDIQEWLNKSMGAFGGHVSARVDTLAAYPEQNFVSFVVDQRRLRQPMAATNTMVRAGVGQFMDNENQLWEVVKAEEGLSYIMRKESTSIEEMLAVRDEALRGAANARQNVTLAAMDSIPSAGGGFATMDLGDTVDFYHNGQIHRGKVQSAGASGVRVTSNGGDTYTIDPAAVTSVVEKSAGAAKESDDVMRRYYSTQYPGNPAMTEIVSPLSNKPVKDTRPPPGNEDLQPIEVAASARVSGSVRPFVKTSK